MENRNPYGAIDAAPLDPALLKKNLAVQTRIWWNSSVAGSKAKVLKSKKTSAGKVVVYCRYGFNQSGQPLDKWMPCEYLALAN